MSNYKDIIEAANKNEITEEKDTNNEVEKVITLTYKRKVQPYLNDIVDWRREGDGVNEICYKLDINPSTFYEYKKRYPEFADAWEVGSELLVDNMEKSLYKESMGYDYEEQSLAKDGTAVTVKKHARGSIGGLKFALKNLRSKKWSSKDKQENSVAVTGLNIEALKQLSVSDLKKLLATKSGKEDVDD